MNFSEKLSSYIGETVQMVTGFQVATGQLIAVTEITATIRAASAPGDGYGGGQDIIFQLNRITYARVL